MTQTAPTAMPRRAFLRHVFLTGAAAGAGPLLSACFDGGRPGGAAAAPGSGPTPAPSLPPGPAAGGGQLSIPSGPLAGIGPLQAANADELLLPEGFSSRIVAQNSSASLAAISSTGYAWHPFPDGGATYARDNGGWIYTSNSEVLLVDGLGGCGALVFDPDGSIVDAYSILTGTAMNCAGGKTPWGTWLSCEETGSGMTWECDPYNPGQGIAKPALGLFAHEAAVVDLENRTLYQTEDTGDGRFYRWVADPADFDAANGRLAMEQGRLQVMNIAGFEDGGDTADATEQLRTLHPVTWVDALAPDQPQSSNRGPGTIFDGGEGCWFYELPPAVRTVPEGGSRPTKGLVFFSTKGDNRVWAYDIENALVELIFDNSQIDPAFSDVDNITVSPRGDILVAEDNPDTGAIRIMVLIPNQPSKVLVQLSLRHTGSEICGPAFSPDGSRLYFSSQRGPDFFGAPTGTTFEVTIPEAFR